MLIIRFLNVTFLIRNGLNRDLYLFTATLQPYLTEHSPLGSHPSASSCSRRRAAQTVARQVL